jgi:hypothetical protein
MEGGDGCKKMKTHILQKLLQESALSAGAEDISTKLETAVGLVMKVMPGPRMSTVNAELPPLGDNEQCAICLEFKDGSKERHRGTAPTLPEEGVTERNKRGGTKGGEQLEFSALRFLAAPAS